MLAQEPGGPRSVNPLLPLPRGGDCVRIWTVMEKNISHRFICHILQTSGSVCVALYMYIWKIVGQECEATAEQFNSYLMTSLTLLLNKISILFNCSKVKNRLSCYSRKIWNYYLFSLTLRFTLRVVCTMWLWQRPVNHRSVPLSLFIYYNNYYYL